MDGRCRSGGNRNGGLVRGGTLNTCVAASAYTRTRSSVPDKKKRVSV